MSVTMISSGECNHCPVSLPTQWGDRDGLDNIPHRCGAGRGRDTTGIIEGAGEGL